VSNEMQMILLKLIVLENKKSHRLDFLKPSIRLLEDNNLLFCHLKTLDYLVKKNGMSPLNILSVIR
jgi:hypothetical protein